MNWFIIFLGKRLLPFQIWAITWTSADLLSIGALGKKQQLNENKNINTFLQEYLGYYDVLFNFVWYVQSLWICEVVLFLTNFLLNTIFIILTVRTLWHWASCSLVVWDSLLYVHHYDVTHAIVVALWCHPKTRMHPFHSLLWCHNEREGVSNHWRLDCLLNRLFRCRSKKTSKLHVTGLCEENQR